MFKIWGGSISGNALHGSRKVRYCKEVSSILAVSTFKMGYFEISASQVRTKNNRVLFNTFEKFQATDNLRTWPVIAKANERACLDWDK